MSVFEGVYYAGPQEFNPTNMAYVQRLNEVYEEHVDAACEYIRENYGDSLTKDEMDRIIEHFEIPYPLLPQYLVDKLDEFDIIDY